MNKYQRVIDQIIKSDGFSMLFPYRDNKKMIKEVTKGFTLKDMVEWKNHRKGEQI